MANRKKEGAPAYNVIGILGLIGAGKSTLVQKCSRIPCIHVVKENIDDYTSFKEHNPLEQMYSDPVKNSPIAQLHFIKCVNQIMIETIKNTPQSKILVSDRTLFCPLTFIQTQYDEGTISKFTSDYLRTETFETAEKTVTECNIKYIGIFYIATPTATCKKRIVERNRSCEQNIPMKYLDDLESEYMNHLHWWKMKIGPERVMTVDGTQSSEVLFDKFCDF